LLTGQVAAPVAALSPISVPLAELFNVALEYERAGRLADAERMLGHVLAAAPTQADALHLAGIVAYRLGRKSDALDFMQRSMRHGVNTPLYWRNIGEVLRVLGKLDEALAAGRRAVALNPDDPVTLANLAVIRAQRQEFDQAEACERAALALDPGHAGAHFGLAEVLLARGDFARGWEEYEWRYKLEGAGVNLPPGGGRQWNGHPMQGRLLVIADQGYGDTIQFGRYLPWALQRCTDVVVASGPEMWPLLTQLGARTLRNRWQDLPPWDAYIPLTGLPRLAGTRLETVPADIPYLHAPPVLASRWATRLDQLLPPGMRRVGLVWAGRPSHVNDHRRSAPLASLAPLFALTGVAYVSLQKGRQSELARLHGAAPIVNLGPELATWEDTGAVLSGLDAVVSVDTAVAHLAGALGRRVHLLLPHAAEWRWLLGRDTSPWYPTMRLHRQHTPGNWTDCAASAARHIRHNTKPR
jgi:hypothetical protein